MICYRFSHEIEDLKLKLELSLQELAKTKKQVEEIVMEKKSLGATLDAKDKILQDYSELKASIIRQFIDSEIHLKVIFYIYIYIY